MPASRAFRPSFLLFGAPVIALALASGLAIAQCCQTPPPGSIALRWNDCYGDHGAAARTFACDTNSGADVLVISAYPPADMPQLNGAETALTVWSTDASTPSWWTFQSGGCRTTAGMSPSFVRPVTSTACLDPWLGQAAGGYAFEPNYYAPNVARLRTVCAIPGTASVAANTEVYVTSILIRHTRTVGTGSCAGCPIAACIGLQTVRLYQPLGVGDYEMFNPLPGTTSDVVGWQMDASMTEHIGSTNETMIVWQKFFLSCAAAVTPARRPTWGAVKSLYR